MIDHITFAIASYARSKAFYTKALAPLGYELVMEPQPFLGGFGKAGKGPRPIYHPGYFGAFVLDPDGNNVEAVIHT